MTEVHSQEKKRIKPGYILFPVSVLLAIASFIEINNAFMVGMLGVPVALSIFISRFKNRNVLSRKSKYFSYVGCIVLIMSGPSGCAYNTFKIKQSILSASLEIEDLKRIHGYSPETEEYRMGKHPVCYGSNRKIMYIKRHTNDYSLTCVTFGFNKLTYESDSKQWINWD